MNTAGQGVSERRGGTQKHGLSRLSEYDSWVLMRRRCGNSSWVSYHLYGGRGIKVCAEWEASVEAFLRDMGRKPGPEYTLDRIDNNGNYEPGNCRWASRETQGSNRRNVRHVDFQGESMSLMRACKLAGVGYSAAKWRLNRNRDWRTGAPSAPSVAEGV